MRNSSICEPERSRYVQEVSESRRTWAEIRGCGKHFNNILLKEFDHVRLCASIVDGGQADRVGVLHRSVKVIEQLCFRWGWHRNNGHCVVHENAWTP